MIYPSEIEIGKGLRKTTQQFLLIFCIFKIKILPVLFQNITQPVKKK